MLEFVISFLLTIIFAPLIIFFLKRLKFGQNILGYVVEHKSKQGTPTMGGVIFILPTIIVGLIFNFAQIRFVLFVLSVFLGFSLIGFLDDFIKIKFKRNLGLRAYQKVIFQFLLSLIVAVYIYRNKLISNEIIIPFFNTKIDCGFLIIPLVILTFLACTNSVNLTDGLDGLAGGVSLICFLAFEIFISVFSFKYNFFNPAFSLEINSLKSICLCMSGALMGYLIFNCYPAKIFMGDTGSLGIGGLLAMIACVCKLELFLVVVGIMFVVSAVSVILQVVVFKSTKKRLFLMAPFHHHLQHRGMHENRVVIIYITITILASIACLLFM